jgi:hypothetical protein
MLGFPVDAQGVLIVLEIWFCGVTFKI